jgi:hypothetical protein
MRRASSCPQDDAEQEAEVWRGLASLLDRLGKGVEDPATEPDARRLLDEFRQGYQQLLEEVDRNRPGLLPWRRRIEASLLDLFGPAGRTEDPLDAEELLPASEPIRTLEAYVALIEALEESPQDSARILSERGLDPMEWVECVTSWSRLIQERPELAQRFALLRSRN